MHLVALLATMALTLSMTLSTPVPVNVEEICVHNNRDGKLLVKVSWQPSVRR